MIRARTFGILLLVVLVSVAVSACGKDSDDGGGDGDGNGRPGQGRITASFSSFPDFLDPALSFTSEGWQTLWSVYTPLLTYRHAPGTEGSELVPGLAEKLPEVSDDGRTYKLRLREGLRYSDGAPVRASDFEHTIRRVLKLASGGARFFEPIVGAKAYEKAGRARADIPGIVANDRTRDITIRLEAPSGSFANVLAMDFAALVPGDTPFANRTKAPPPGVGPFRLADVEVNRSFALVRNPRFEIEGLPQAKLARIDVKVVKSNARATQDTIDNKLDLMNDPPDADLLGEVRDRYEGKRYEEFVTNSSYFFFLNARTPPFDDLRVRRAVNFAVDKRALVRLFSGLMQPSCNYLPPGMRGYKKIDPCPYGDPEKAANVGRARTLVRAAGAAGQTVIVYGLDDPESQRVTDYFTDVLNSIGLKARSRNLEPSVYFQVVGNATTKAQAGFANFFEDYPHPSDFFALVDGRTIQSTNNPNLGNTNDPVLNRGLARLDRIPKLADAADGYAALDKRVVDQAHLVPYGHRKLSVFMSDRMQFGDECNVVHPVYNADFASLCLK